MGSESNHDDTQISGGDGGTLRNKERVSLFTVVCSPEPWNGDCGDSIICLHFRVDDILFFIPDFSVNVEGVGHWEADLGLKMLGKC
ncbi:uncharacterized protein HKW66_Vig0172420 [Vigna angularis]|uniref:Uncharacterized protein n=1 Tax=Phaseolus angularis TaxID=3914 RepID=A0A8T0JRT7_PHAAN|nr:uncharacterized protein HKW66_Vig0172420 [Vigna angularis]